MNRNTVDRRRHEAGLGRRAATRPRPRSFGPERWQRPRRSASTGSWSGRRATSGSQNLTACNFLHGAGDTGNEIWWNGGDGQRQDRRLRYSAPYLNATSTFFNGEDTAAAVRDLLEQLERRHLGPDTYASNFNDSGVLHRRLPAAVQPGRRPRVGASTARSATRARTPAAGCRQELGVRQQPGRVRHQQPERRQPAAAERRVPAATAVEHDHPDALVLGVHATTTSTTTTTRTSPRPGSAAAGPVGTGMTISGGRNDTVMDNRFVNNSAWGIVLVPFTDSGPPCTGGTLNSPISAAAVPVRRVGRRDDPTTRSATTAATGTRPTATLEQLNFESGIRPTASGQHGHGGGASTGDLRRQQTAAPSVHRDAGGGRTSTTRSSSPRCCATRRWSFGTPSAASPSGPYPRKTEDGHAPAAAKQLKSMPNPCAGVPKNPWCPGAKA